MNIFELTIYRTSTVRQALAQLDKTARGVLLLLAPDGRFERTLTDGDLRRLLLAGGSLDDSLSRLATAQAITLPPKHTRREALALMQRYTIDHLPVVDDTGSAIDLVERKEVDKQVLLSTPHMGDAELEFVMEAFQTNWIAPLGPNVDAFEHELAELVGASHAVALSSGTAAIHLALVMLGVGQGDSVFCSTLTFAASANPIIYQGAEPVFIDSEPGSWNMSPAALERAFVDAAKAGHLPKAVIIVCLYGQSADMEALAAICDRYGVPIIEDSAESLGAKYRGKSSGTFGKFGIYSFNGNKIITTSGGGMLITEDGALAARARFLATQARDPAPYYQHSTIGYNYRMSNILAGVGRGQLRVLADRVAARRAVFEAYQERLASLDWIEWMPTPEWSYSTHWLTAATIKPEISDLTASEVVSRLAAEFIEARPIWKPMHLQPVFAHNRYYPHGNTSVSDVIFERGFCLPSGSNLTSENIDRVVIALASLR
jgi:dTDP-4-amino-4,6-dideoxygalactose transaminase